jgi:hypothetical protein
MTGQEFKSIGLELGLTRPGMARFMGFSLPSTVGDIESGRAPITDRIARLATTFSTYGLPVKLAGPVTRSELARRVMEFHA